MVNNSTTFTSISATAPFHCQRSSRIIQEQTWVKYIIALDQILFYALLSLSGVLEPMKYSQKVQAMPSGLSGWISCPRQDQPITENYLNLKQLHI